MGGRWYPVKTGVGRSPVTTLVRLGVYGSSVGVVVGRHCGGRPTRVVTSPIVFFPSSGRRRRTWEISALRVGRSFGQSSTDGTADPSGGSEYQDP